jgi:hypothetical protein
MAIRGDAMTRRVFTIRRLEGRWQVSDGEALLADCADFDLANAAAARLAREAFNAGVAVKIDKEGWT